MICPHRQIALAYDFSIRLIRYNKHIIIAKSDYCIDNLDLFIRGEPCQGGWSLSSRE